MKTAIVYYSKHHGNTRKLLDAIAAQNEVTLIDVTQTPEAELSSYDRVGFASGIYYSKFHKSLLKFAQARLPEGTPTFLLYTYGAKKAGYTDAIRAVLCQRNAKLLGEYGCFGFNTFGPFKLIGGMAKGHPDAAELAAACEFYRAL